jgi:serine protease
MPRFRFRSGLAVAAPLALALGVWVAGHAQSRAEWPLRPADQEDTQATAPSISGRVLAQPVSAAAIDRGVVDPSGVTGPRRPGGRAMRPHAHLPYEPGKIIVKFREGGTSTARGAAMREARATGIERPSYADFDLLAIDSAADPEAIAAALAARADVEYAQAAYRVRPYFRPNDPLYAQQWNFPLMNLEPAWDINRGGTSSVIVAVLDTGVAFESAIYEFTARAFVDDGVSYPSLGRVTVPFAPAPELGGASRFVAPRDFIWNDGHPVDLDGHGTHVAGTVASLTNNGVGVAGIAFNVRVMPVKCISSDWDDIFSSPNVGTDDVVARAIRYAADNGATVINMSLGRNEGPAAPAIGDAMRYAVSRGAFIAVAGGNDFDDGNPPERLAEQAAPIDGALVVAAVGPDRKRAFYSGVRSYIEIAAPGGNSRLPNGTILQQTFDAAFADTFLLPPARYGPPRFDVFAYRFFQGTSMATAHVSGLAALLMSQGVASPAAVEAALKRFAVDRGPAGRDDEYGHGLIDARATLRGLGIVR